jgi:hypothetical protein
MNGYELGINDLVGPTPKAFILCFQLHINDPLKCIIIYNISPPPLNEISRASQFNHIFIDAL